jgi:hypothetical protein
MPAPAAAAVGSIGSKALGWLGRRAARRGVLRPGDTAEKIAYGSLGLFGLLLLALLLLIMPVLWVLQGAIGADNTIAGTPTPVKEIPAEYWGIYTLAAAHYEISPYLLASIHKQESGFSTNATVGSGVNSYGCCAGPMQFNVRGGTWAVYMNGFRPVARQRPNAYPLDRRNAQSCQGAPGSLPCQAYRSCRGVPANNGCVYDDFDAIAAAAMKLSHDGADEDLYSRGTHAAVCAYIGSCSEVDHCTGSPNQDCEVLTRAREWELTGIRPIDFGVHGGARGIVEQAAGIAERYGAYVCSGYRPGSITTSGSVSDHAFNDENRAARDLAMPGTDCINGPPTPPLDLAAVAIGRMFGRLYERGETIVDTFAWKGFRIQIIWRTPAYGGHMGHIHVGARRL